MISFLLSLLTVVAPSPVLAAEDKREIPPVIMGRSRDFFAKVYRDTYGADAEGTTYVSCTSTDEDVALVDFYLLRPRPPASPVLVYFHRDDYSIGNYGTVRYYKGEVDMWAGNGGNGTSEAQRIVAEPLLAESALPANNIADVFMIVPTKKCAFAASAYLQRPAVPAPK